MTALYAVLLVVVVLAALAATVWLKQAGDRSWREHRTRELATPPRDAFEKFVSVTITADASRFVAAMRAASEAAEELRLSLRPPTRRERFMAAVRRLLGGTV